LHIGKYAIEKTSITVTHFEAIDGSKLLMVACKNNMTFLFEKQEISCSR